MSAGRTTFLYGDVVVKLFGYFRSWRESHAAERAAQALVATDPEIAAPRRVRLVSGWRVASQREPTS